MDAITLALAKKGAKAYTDTVVGNLPKGVVFKGSVNYYNDLPNNAEIGDCYTVIYTGTSGTTPDGTEYVWGVNTATSTQEWINFGPNLDNYVKNTDYATSDTGGVVKANTFYGLDMYNGTLLGVVKTYAQYQSENDNAFISKGTLENVITGKDLTTKAYVDGLVGDINTALEAI